MKLVKDQANQAQAKLDQAKPSESKYWTPETQPNDAFQLRKPRKSTKQSK